MASSYLYRYDTSNPPVEIDEAAAALSTAEVDLVALPWVRVDLTSEPPTAYACEGAVEGVPTGAVSITVDVPALVLP